MFPAIGVPAAGVRLPGYLQAMAENDPAFTFALPGNVNPNNPGAIDRFGREYVVSRFGETGVANGTALGVGLHVSLAAVGQAARTSQNSSITASGARYRGAGVSGVLANANVNFGIAAGTLRTATDAVAGLDQDIAGTAASFGINPRLAITHVHNIFGQMAVDDRVPGAGNQNGLGPIRAEVVMHGFPYMFGHPFSVPGVFMSTGGKIPFQADTRSRRGARRGRGRRSRRYARRSRVY